jgi:hypothetical protein
MPIDGEDTTLTIGRAEALILFEMLADFYNQSAIEISSPAQRLALVRLHGALQKSLVEPFMPEYRKLIEEAESLLSAQFGTE